MKNILNKIEIDYTTYILIFIALLAGYIKNISIIIIILLIHEIGHIIFFILFKFNIEKIKFYPFGGITIINKKLHERIYKDILCSIGGILFQILLMFIYYLLFKYDLIKLSTYNIFKTYNTSIIIFNILPIIPLDGSKLLFTILTKYISYYKSYILMIITGIISLILFIIYNFIFKLNDIILYIFLIIKIIEVIKNFKYIINKFYLERIIYDNYYDGIINNCHNIKYMKLNKYYYFNINNKYINEKAYLKRNYLKR